jgi:hypothetical protein
MCTFRHWERSFQSRRSMGQYGFELHPPDREPQCERRPNIASLVLFGATVGGRDMLLVSQSGRTFMGRSAAKITQG